MNCANKKEEEDFQTAYFIVVLAFLDVYTVSFFGCYPAF
jgi:hypothetical protein